VYGVAIRDDIRSWVLLQGKSQRSAAKQFGVSRDTVARLLREPGEESDRRYRRKKPRPAPVRQAALPYVQQWLAENEQLKPWAKKQQWTAHRMWVELRRLDIMVAESTVRELVREQRRTDKPVYVPLVFAPGERAEFDFGHAYVLLNGRRVRLPFLAGRLRYSGAMFVEFFPTERQDSFLMGQRHAFEFWGGVPQSAIYDNTNAIVQKFLQGHHRVEQPVFRHFRTAYLFEAVFASPGAGWEKGSVENLVGMARRNYMVPLPEAPTIEALNAQMLEQCEADQARVMRGRSETIAVRLKTEREHLRALPERPVEIGSVREVVASSQARVRFETNQYSIPVTHAYCQLTLKADPFRVRCFHGAELIAEHARCYERNQLVEGYRHYVPLLLQKSAAVPFATCLRNGALPPIWEQFRLRLVAERPGGNREFARVLELCLREPEGHVTAAVEAAFAAGTFSADAVRQYLRFATERDPRVTPLDPTTYPSYQLPQRKPNLADYNRLLEVGR
jgi:transposase